MILEILMWLQAHGEKTSNLANLNNIYEQYFCLFKKKTKKQKKPWLILVNVWQKPLQYCGVISLQLIKKK